jgi:hypothetical protein
MIHIIYLVEGVGAYHVERAAYETPEAAIEDMRKDGLVVEVVAKLSLDGCVVRVGRDDFATITPMRLFDAEEARPASLFPQSQRDAMRRAVATHGDNKEACVRYWLNELEDGNVGLKAGSNSARDPQGYAERLYADGEAKGWLHHNPRGL